MAILELHGRAGMECKVDFRPFGRIEQMSLARPRWRFVLCAVRLLESGNFVEFNANVRGRQRGFLFRLVFRSEIGGSDGRTGW